jgi:beta-lactam-binding protein with PASTA domain
LRIKRFAVLLLKNGLLLLALLVTAGLSALATMRVVLSAQDVAVPSLLSTRVTEAGALAARRGLSLRVEGKRNDPRIPVDQVMAQEPPPGSTLKKHRSIRVWLSLGPHRTTVPAVEGESLRSARLSLDQGLVPIARVVEVNDPAEEGMILLQRPGPGETDSVGDGMSLLVSRGPTAADYVMPDLIGRRAEDAVDGLRRVGLKVAEVRYRSYPGVAPGIVLRQIPASGHRVNRRTSVSLDISRAQ